MKIDTKIVKGWYEPIMVPNLNWRWWAPWRDKKIIELQFILDEKGDVEIEMTVIDFEEATAAEGYEWMRKMARVGKTNNGGL